MAGWLIALVAWVVSGAYETAGQLLTVWILTLLVALGEFAHSIAGAAEVMTSALAGRTSWPSYATWQVAATIGNIFGGVIIVSLLNHGQVKSKDH